MDSHPSSATAALNTLLQYVKLGWCYPAFHNGDGILVGPPEYYLTIAKHIRDAVNSDDAEILVLLAETVKRIECFAVMRNAHHRRLSLDKFDLAVGATISQ